MTTNTTHTDSRGRIEVRDAAGYTLGRVAKAPGGTVWVAIPLERGSENNMFTLVGAKYFSTRAAAVASF